MISTPAPTPASTHAAQGDGMKVPMTLFVAAVGVAATSRLAHADAPPAWCGSAAIEASGSDLQNLKHSEPETVVRALAKTRCSTAPEVAQNHASIDAARAAWGKKLGMVEADWADAVDFIGNRDGNYPKIEYSTKVLAKLTPMDQFRAIRDGLETDGRKLADAIYAADALNGQLTEVGRLALLEWCLQEEVAHDSIGHWAICQADVEAWSFAKFAAQLRSDTAHDGATKMILRFRAVGLDKRLETAAAQREKLFARDAEYKRMFEVALAARKEWAKGAGSDGALLDLVSAMESATFAGSRKLLAGCEDKTSTALAAAVAKLPAKSFAGMADDRNNPFEGFAHGAGPVLVKTPAVNLAATAYALCSPTSPTGDWLRATLQQVAGVRGPRTAALTALYDEKFTFDDVKARTPRYPTVGTRPYARSGGSITSAGGVVAKVTMEKDHAIVALKKTTAKRLACVQSKPTNRVSRIRPDGTLEYESICLKSSVITYDTTWSDFKINPAQAARLKPGVMFSAVYGEKFFDVVATWKTNNATSPTEVLGAALD
jgi:hypothetical protein